MDRYIYKNTCNKKLSIKTHNILSIIDIKNIYIIAAICAAILVNVLYFKLHLLFYLMWYWCFSDCIVWVAHCVIYRSAKRWSSGAVALWQLSKRSNASASTRELLLFPSVQESVRQYEHLSDFTFLLSLCGWGKITKHILTRPNKIQLT